MKFWKKYKCWYIASNTHEVYLLQSILQWINIGLSNDLTTNRSQNIEYMNEKYYHGIYVITMAQRYDLNAWFVLYFWFSSKVTGHIKELLQKQ